MRPGMLPHLPTKFYVMDDGVADGGINPGASAPGR
jgi:hypothetical protein